MLTDLDSVNPNRELPQNTPEEKRRRPGVNSSLQVYTDQQNLDRCKGRWRDTERSHQETLRYSRKRIPKSGRRPESVLEMGGPPHRGRRGQLSAIRSRRAPERNRCGVLQRWVFLENEPNVLNICLQKRGKNNHELKLYENLLYKNVSSTKAVSVCVDWVLGR